MANAKAKNVLQDLVSVMAEQARIAQETAKSAKVQKIAPSGSPYNAPAMSGFVGTKGKNAGIWQDRWSFGHKANPAWSRQYDLTDLELILGNVEAAKAAYVFLKAAKAKKA